MYVTAALVVYLETQMPTTITFFPVDNGDMALIKFGDVDATTLLIDINIRQDAEDPDGVSRDVAKDLRDRLKRDENGRPYVDAFLLSHRITIIAGG